MLVLVATACAPGDGSDDGLTLFAAASLRAVTADLEAAWAETHPDVPLTVATEASNVLAAQIEEGARADIFISADEAQVERLVAAGLTTAEPVTFAHNEIALVARADGPIREVADLAEPGIRVIVGGPSTPIGGYTELALDALAATMPDPEAFSAAVAHNIASREDNVRAALAKVELGEGDAAFVYRTDALGSTDAVQIELPSSARVEAVYSAVQLSDRGIATTFLDWLRGRDMATILRDAGFEVAP